MVDDTAGDHQARVEGTTSNATQWVPCACNNCTSAIYSSKIPILHMNAYVGEVRREAYGHRTSPRNCRSHA